MSKQESEQKDNENGDLETFKFSTGKASVAVSSSVKRDIMQASRFSNADFGAGQIDSYTYRAQIGKQKPTFAVDEDTHFLWEFYITIRRLRELQPFMTPMTKPNAQFLYNKDNVCQAITKLIIATVKGDGMTVKWRNKETEELDLEIEREYDEWLDNCAGIDGGFKDAVIELALRDNYPHGNSVWYKFVDDGEFVLKRLDPLSYVIIKADYLDEIKVIQYPVEQPLTPKTKAEFEKWLPSFRTPYEYYSSFGGSVLKNPISIPSEKLVFFNIFKRPPIESIIEDLTSKMEAKYYQQRALEKFSFPVLLAKVPRNPQRDKDDNKFDAKVIEASKAMADLRIGDGLAVPGVVKNLDGTANLCEAWEIDVLSTHDKVMPFPDAIGLLDKQISWGMYASIDLLQASGAALATEITSTLKNIANDIREVIGKVQKSIAHDWGIFYNKNPEKYDIITEWGVMKEENKPAFVQMVATLVGLGIITIPEGRKEIRKVGINVKELPEEEFPEEEDMMPPEVGGKPPFGLGQKPGLAPTALPRAIGQKPVGTTPKQTTEQPKTEKEKGLGFWRRTAEGGLVFVRGKTIGAAKRKIIPGAGKRLGAKMEDKYEFEILIDNVNEDEFKRFQLAPKSIMCNLFNLSDISDEILDSEKELPDA